jgi:hypothetical protein
MWERQRGSGTGMTARWRQNQKVMRRQSDTGHKALCPVSTGALRPGLPEAWAAQGVGGLGGM